MNTRNILGICLSLATLTAMSCGGDAAESCKSTKAADGSVVLDCGSGGKATLAPGTDGKASLISSAPADAADCPDGGTKFQFGIDEDGSGVLDEAEISQSVNVCQGSAGSAGADGAAGMDGTDGAAGMNGADGDAALVNVSDEAAGANCEAGGQRLEFGVDTDGNGALDAGEVQGTRFICDGMSGFNSLIELTDEAAGGNCVAGGKKLSHGLDADGDGALAAGEIAGSTYLCNGVDGAAGLDGVDGLDGLDGLTTLSQVSPEAAGGNCAAGGTKLEIGVDADHSGSLEAAEIGSVRYICNGAVGANGLNTLVVTAAEAAGGNCAAGGTKVTSGLDSNRNNTLDAAEITSTRYVCNGAAGANGKNALVNVTPEAAGVNCTEGGQKVEYGQDANGNGTLEAAELAGTRYVCNGRLAQFYSGRGIQQNILLSDVEALGWRRCYTDLLNNSHPLATILAGCQGTYMMLACRPTGNATLQLAAADLRSVVTANVGDGNANSTANTVGTGGVSWYFSTSWSWGFFPTGEALNRNSCDVANTQSDKRMCWHTNSGNISNGYRCGNDYTGASYERLVLVY
jgi:hypothetical protein